MRFKTPGAKRIQVMQGYACSSTNRSHQSRFYLGYVDSIPEGLALKAAFLDWLINVRRLPRDEARAMTKGQRRAVVEEWKVSRAA